MFGNGDYPDAIKKFCSELGAMVGAPTRLLPEFTDEEIALNKGVCNGTGNV